MNKKTPVIAIAPDSFKGALDAMGVAKAMAEGFAKVWPKAGFRLVPMADGGEGTVDAWAAATATPRAAATVRDPLGRPVKAEFAFDPASRTAVIEMAAASGLPLLKPDERNPLATTTYGTGELILKALDLGARHIILGIGGSATNDGGAGMASALGAKFLDAKGRRLPPGGGALSRLASIDFGDFDPRIAKTKFEVACDVTNPLCGPNGASAVYGPQKGATKAAVKKLDAALARLADVASATFPQSAKRTKSDAREMPGAGAAGGLGFGLCVFCGARLKRGVEIIAESVGLLEKIRGCDLVVTGEGRLDSQTVNGKTPAGVAAVAKKAGVKCIAICGCVGDGYQAVRKVGIDAVVPIAHGFFDPLDPARGARERIAAAAEETARLLALGIPR